MTLAMTRPWQHPKTGMFWLRRRVPKDLLSLVGKREEKLSLATKEPAEARRRFAKALADVEARWAALRSARSETAHAAEPKQATLSEREAHRRAEWMYTYWLNKYRDDPSTQTFWPVDAHDRLWPSAPMQFRSVLSTEAAPHRKVPRGRDDEEALTADLVELARQCGRYGCRKISALLRGAGWVVNDERVDGSTGSP